MKQIIYFSFSLLMLFASTAEAYTGPGLGAGVIGIVLGILTAVVLTLIAIVWYPLKRLVRLFCNKKIAPTTGKQETKE